MTCIQCKHSVPCNWPTILEKSHYYGYKFTNSDRKAVTLQCTLNPTWMEVKGGHFCSHDTSVRGAVDYNNWSLRTDEYWKNAEEQKTRAINAEKKLKELRRKMRDNK